MSRVYVPREFWDARLTQHWDLSGVGHLRYSERYNRLLYLEQERALTRVLHRANAATAGARVLDVGSGIGYWLAWYRRQGAGDLTALELSPRAVERLELTYPEAQILEADITSGAIELAPFDLVNVISVLYHIVEPLSFDRALANLARLTRSGGALVLSDRLGRRELRSGPHVRFRPLELYREQLSQVGFCIQAVEPVYTLLNGGLRERLGWAGTRVSRWLWRIEEMIAPLLYAVDRAPVFAPWANMRILVARKL